MIKKSKFGIIVGSRGLFNSKLAKEGRINLLEKLSSLGYEYYILPENATPNGVVETRKEAGKYANFFAENRNEIDGIIISLPNFGDELGVINTLDEADLEVPVLVQACDDDTANLDIDHRRDAFCGKLSVCNNLYQYGIKFTNTTYHTCPINSEIFTKDILFFDKVCRVVKGIKKARIGQIGTRPAPFQTTRYSEKLLQEAGITVIPVDLSEIIFAAQNREIDNKIEEKVNEIREYGTVPPYVEERHIEKSAKLAVTLEEWLEVNECDAGAVQCWESIQRNYGCAACLPMSMLGEKGIPMACETDITGAVAMYALYLASGETAGYLDWNNSYYEQRNKCVLTHCSALSSSFLNSELEISYLDVLGKSLGKENCFGACKGKAAPGPVTYAKVSTDDSRGLIKAYLGEGECTADPVKIDGGAVTVEIPDLQKLLDYLCQNGFEHHVAMNRSQTAEVLKEALGKYLGWEVYKHN